MAVKKTQKIGGLSFLSTLLLLFFIVVAVLCATSFYNVHTRRQRLEAEAAALAQQEQALEERKSQLEAQSGRSSAKDIEDAAREQLDMVYPGEIIFRTSGEV